MTSKQILTIGLSLLGSTFALGQGQAPLLPPAPANPPAPSLQAGADPGYAALIATCKNPPPARGARGGGGAGARGAAGAAGAPAAAGARGPQAPAGPRDVTVTEIPGVIAAGQQWKFLWQEAGNNGDGIVGTNDGDLLLAQNDNSKVVKLDKNGKTSVVYSDTHTGGALSMSPKGVMFINERGLHQRIVQLPQRKVLADNYQGDPLDCIGGVLNDLTADSKGGVYFTQGGVYYASPKGVVTKYGDTGPNGIILSANEKILYATNGPSLAAFDVQPDGSLTNQREFAKLEGGGNGDGSTIDAAGRIYVTTNPGVQVISPEGKYLGLIPTPRGVITTAFGGKDKKTLFILARGAKDASGNEVANAAQVYTIQMIAQGYKGRAK
jgi:sugar lactone lactonase YvrE